MLVSRVRGISKEERLHGIPQDAPLWTSPNPALPVWGQAKPGDN